MRRPFGVLYSSYMRTIRPKERGIKPLLLFTYSEITCARRIHSAVKHDTICRESELTGVNCRDYIIVGRNKVAASGAGPATNGGLVHDL